MEKDFINTGVSRCVSPTALKCSHLPTVVLSHTSLCLQHLSRLITADSPRTSCSRSAWGSMLSSEPREQTDLSVVSEG